MAVKSIEGFVQQSAADVIITDRVIPLMTNSTSKFGVPLIRVLSVKLEFDVQQVRQWAAVSCGYASIYRWPFSVKIPKVELNISLGVQGIIQPFIRVEPSQGFPLIAGDEVAISLNTLATGRINKLFYQVFFEEVENPSELELTKILWG